MTKATEVALSHLHGAVTRALTMQIEQVETVYDEYTEEGEPLGEGQVVSTASPAALAASIKFLKDNQITCDIEENDNVSNLRDKLEKQQKRSRLNASTAAKLEVVGG